MKKILFTTITALFFTSFIFGQAPHLVKFKGVAKDANGDPIEGNIRIKLTVLEGSEDGTEVYKEEWPYPIPAEANGLFNVTLGGGSTMLNTFDNIDWANGTYFLKVSIDPTGIGTDFQEVGVQAILSVPYSLYANVADTASYSIFSENSIFADEADFAFHAETADNAETANHATTADTTDFAQNSQHANEADSANHSVFADTASWAIGPWQTLDNNIYVEDEKIGIGTFSPLFKLHINSSDPATNLLLSRGDQNGLTLRVDGNNDAFISNLNDFVSNGTLNNEDIIIASEEDIQFRTGGNPSQSSGTLRMVVNNNGSVGIGNNDPADGLDVNRGGVIVSSQNNIDVGLRLFTNRPDLSQSAWSGTAGSENRAWKIGARNHNQSGSAKGDLFFAYWNDENWIQPMTIDSETGNVGIGVSSPDKNLEVQSPGQAEIHIDGGTNSYLLLDAATDNNYSRVIFQKNGTTKGYISYDHNSGSTLEDLDFFVGGNNRMTIRGNGNVGIGTGGTSLNKAKLQIEGHANYNLANSGHNTYAWFGINNAQNNDASGFDNSSANNYSIYASSRIAGVSFHAHSDARIKNIQGISDSKADLKTLREIQVTDYVHKDYISKGTTPQKKVIAQQVARVFPQAVITNNVEVIPDIMQHSVINDGWVSLNNHSLETGDKIRLIFESGMEELKVTDISADGFQVTTDQQGKVFVYGREVDDFHTVDYEAIAMLNVSATQELIKVIEQQKTEIRNLKSFNENVMARLENLEKESESLVNED